MLCILIILLERSIEGAQFIFFRTDVQDSYIAPGQCTYSRLGTVVDAALFIAPYVLISILR